MSAAFAHYERSMINGRNLAAASEKWAVNVAERALADGTGTIEALEAARAALAAKLARIGA